MTRVAARTGARLHFGLILGSPASGWEFGGAGLMVAQPGWKISGNCLCRRSHLGRITRHRRSYHPPPAATQKPPACATTAHHRRSRNPAARRTGKWYSAFSGIDRSSGLACQRPAATSG
ncbi:MAG UNVERIFIED_CONTAM: hypothetical protein LVR18_43685 [Planctomycetaceae bacterium]|jgi:hypothetical protein